MIIFKMVSQFAEKALLLFTLHLATNYSVLAQDNNKLTKQQWLEDLNFTVKTLKAQHLDIYYRISKEEFQKNITYAETKINQSHSDEECYTALCQIVASIRDGHTRLMSLLPAYNWIFPVRIYEFSDGVFITGITDKYEKFIGAEVIKTGRLSVQEALREAGDLAFADNDFGEKSQAPIIALTRSYAYGLGITQSVDTLTLEIETKAGNHETIILLPVMLPDANPMLNGIDIGPAGIEFKSAFTGTGKQLPLFIKHLDGNHNYWFEHDKESKMLYMQFSRVTDQQDESFKQFYSRMFKYYDEHAGTIDKFILDLRFNGGGEGLITIPFINEIIKRDKINRIGSFYTLTGRRTFSAAVLLIAELMLHTNTLLVGEPPGAAQNMFSDLQGKGLLPNCGANLILSTAYFNIAWPAGENYLIPPHYPVQFSSSDFFSGKDPALEAIMANKVKALETVFYEDGPEAALAYFNNINYDWGLHKNETSITPGTFPVAKYKFGETVLNNIGFDYMNRNKMNEAGATFNLNVKLFPDSFNTWDSYAEYFMKCKDNNNAVKYYKKSLELNPDNLNAKKKLRELGVIK